MDPDFRPQAQSSTNSGNEPVKVEVATAPAIGTAASTESVAVTSDPQSAPSAAIAAAAAELEKEDEIFNNPGAKEEATQPDRAASDTNKPKAKKSKRTALIIISLLATSLISAAAGWFAHDLLAKPETSQNSTPAPVAKTTEVAKALDAAGITAKVKKTYNGTALVYTEGYGAAHKANGSKFFVSPTSTSVTSLAYSTPTASAGDVYNKIKQIFSAEKYTESPVPGDQSATPATTLISSNNSVICGLTNLPAQAVGTTPAPANTNNVRVDCADSTTYTTLNNKLSSYYDLIVAATPEVAKIERYVLKDFTPANSKTGGFITAKIPADSGTAYFYQSADKKWHFVKSSTTLLACTDFNTTELKQAFAGEKCMNGTGTAAKEAVVQ